MTQELLDAIKAQGRKHSDLTWYYQVIKSQYQISDDVYDKLNEIESKYPDEVQELHDPAKIEWGSDEATDFFNDLMSREPGLSNQYNRGVEAALTWVMAVNEFGLEKANEEYPIHEYMELDHM